MKAIARAILGGKMDVEPPKPVNAFLDLRSDLVGALVGMPVGRRIEATKNLARYCARHWRGEESLRALMVIERYGATAEFREIVRDIVVTDAWREFAKAYSEMISFAIVG